jgi:hypothetical protein
MSEQIEWSDNPNVQMGRTIYFVFYLK